MVRKDEGVVLRAARSGETSKLVTFLGRQSGKVRLLAKGAMSAKSAYRGALEPGNHAEVVYYFKEGRTLYFVREVHVFSSLETERSTLVRLASSLAGLELVDDVCYWESPDAKIVDLLVGYLTHPEPEDPILSFLAFEFELLSVLGALPDFSACATCGARTVDGFFHPREGESACPRHSAASSQRIGLDDETISLLERLAAGGMAASASLEIRPELRKRLGSILHWTYTFHVQNYRLPESLKLIPKERGFDGADGGNGRTAEGVKE